MVAELQAPDRIIIGTPMYDFTIPAVLKACIDQVVRVGVIAVDNVRQLTGKKFTVILASGGDCSPGSPIEGYDHASRYLSQVLGFIGITDLDIVLAGRARAGMAGETAVEEFGEVLALAAAA